MNQNLLDDLKKALEQDERFIIDGQIVKNKVIEMALALDGDLIKLLLKAPAIKQHFFKEVETVLVFDKQEFIRFVNNKNFLPDSFTSFKNKIGLVGDNGQYLSQSKEVVLAFPYKDCVLEGGQDKEDAKRKEVFWNETLAPDEIDRLLDAKTLTNFKKYDQKGEHQLNADEVNFENENLIIKGNNLLALHSLKECFESKVKLIYIDPPYNTGGNGDTFQYNNNFKRSTWLTFMKNRLDVAKKLLTNDGALVVAIDENEQAHLGVLLNEMFPNHEIHCVTVVHNPRGIQGTNFSYTNEYAFFVIPSGQKTIGNKKINEEEVKWRGLRDNGGESLRSDAKNCFYSININQETGEVVSFGDVCSDEVKPNQNEVDGNLIKVYPVDSAGIERKWRYARQSVEKVKHLLKAKKSRNGLYDIQIGKDFGMYRTVWSDRLYDANEYGTKLVKKLVPDCKFSFPKSLYTTYDCIHAVVADDPNAIILDYHAGSGTTAHATIELNKQDGGSRKFIAIEQMDYIENVTCKRVQAAGGEFVYCELKELNQGFVNQIQEASNTNALLEIWENMKSQGFLSYRIDVKSLDNNYEAFKIMTLDEQKQILISVLDKNQLYVNYSEINDADFAISDEDKALNHKFYQN